MDLHPDFPVATAGMDRAEHGHSEAYWETIRRVSVHLPEPHPLHARGIASAGHHDVAKPPRRQRPHRRRARLRGQSQVRVGNPGAAPEGGHIARTTMARTAGNAAGTNPIADKITCRASANKLSK